MENVATFTFLDEGYFPPELVCSICMQPPCCVHHNPNNTTTDDVVSDEADGGNPNHANYDSGAVVVKPCGHLFCSGCLNQAMEHKAECPLDRTPIQRTPNVIPDDALDTGTTVTGTVEQAPLEILSQLRHLIVKCNSEQCNWEGTVTEWHVLAHETTCPALTFPCTIEGCNLICRTRVELEEHQRHAAGMHVELMRKKFTATAKENTELRSELSNIKGLLYSMRNDVTNQMEHMNHLNSSLKSEVGTLRSVLSLSCQEKESHLFDCSSTGVIAGAIEDWVSLYGQSTTSRSASTPITNTLWDPRLAPLSGFLAVSPQNDSSSCEGENHPQGTPRQVLERGLMGCMMKTGYGWGTLVSQRPLPLLTLSPGAEYSALSPSVTVTLSSCRTHGDPGATKEPELSPMAHMVGVTSMPPSSLLMSSCGSGLAPSSGRPLLQQHLGSIQGSLALQGSGFVWNGSTKMCMMMPRDAQYADQSPDAQPCYGAGDKIGFSLVKSIIQRKITCCGESGNTQPQRVCIREVVEVCVWKNGMLIIPALIASSGDGLSSYPGVYRWVIACGEEREVTHAEQVSSSSSSSSVSMMNIPAMYVAVSVSEDGVSVTI